jgi:hypothetical protein
MRLLYEYERLQVHVAVVQAGRQGRQASGWGGQGAGRALSLCCTRHRH